MPLWEIFHTASAFAEPQAKAWLAGNITAIYVAVGLPAFYVNIFFRLVQAQDMWIGGRPAGAVEDEPAALERPFIRFRIDHLAIHRGHNKTDGRLMCDKFDEVLKPHLEGYDWEYNIIESDANLWRINGFIPPLHGSADEKTWIETGNPVPYEATLIRDEAFLATQTFY